MMAPVPATTGRISLPRRLLYPAALKEAWVLRNLTTKEYARVRFDTKTQRGFVETDLLRLSVEDALLLSFCWTTDEVYDRDYLDIGSGPWAGHAFDIVLAEEELPVMQTESWKDITEDVVQNARAKLWALKDMAKRYDRKDEDYRLMEEEVKQLSFYNE